MERIQIGRQLSARRQPEHPLLGMPQPLAQPEGIGLLEARGPQDPPHLLGAAATRVGEHGQGGGTLLQGGGQGVGVAAMQADPTGVLPGTAEAGEGQLQA